jgi:hypothetical protein
MDAKSSANLDQYRNGKNYLSIQFYIFTLSLPIRDEQNKYNNKKGCIPKPHSFDFDPQRVDTLINVFNIFTHYKV